MIKLNLNKAILLWLIMTNTFCQLYGQNQNTVWLKRLPKFSGSAGEITYTLLLRRMKQEKLLLSVLAL